MPRASESQHTLIVSRLKDTPFVPGRRESFEYRDLGPGSATEGAVSAVVIASKAGMQEATDWHFHDCQWQMIYMLGGWAEMHFVEDGEIRPVRLEAGDFYLASGGIVHREVEASDDLIALEVVIPAQLGTVSVEPPEAAAS